MADIYVNTKSVPPLPRSEVLKDRSVVLGNYTISQSQSSTSPGGEGWLEALFELDETNHILKLKEPDGNVLHFYNTSGEVAAFATSAAPPNWWDNMPIATTSSLGGIIVGSGLTITSEGILSADGGSGSSTFKGLTDTPNDYAGQAGKYVVVNSSEDGLIYTTGGGGGGYTTFKQLTDTPNSYVFQAGKMLVVNSAEGGIEFVDVPVSTTFAGLSDTPDHYINSGGKLLAVKSSETGIEYIDIPSGKLIELTDTPTSYSGQANKILSVKTTEDGIEFTDAPDVSTNLSITHNSDNVIVVSSTGSNGTINAATQTVAGVMTASDKQKLDSVVGKLSKKIVDDGYFILGSVTHNQDNGGKLHIYGPPHIDLYLDITFDDNPSAEGKEGRRIRLDGYMNTDFVDILQKLSGSVRTFYIHKQPFKDFPSSDIVITFIDDRGFNWSTSISPVSDPQGSNINVTDCNYLRTNGHTAEQLFRVLTPDIWPTDYGTVDINVSGGIRNRAEGQPLVWQVDNTGIVFGRTSAQMSILDGASLLNNYTLYPESLDLLNGKFKAPMGLETIQGEHSGIWIKTEDYSNNNHYIITAVDGTGLLIGAKNGESIAIEPTIRIDHDLKLYVYKDAEFSGNVLAHSLNVTQSSTAPVIFTGSDYTGLNLKAGNSLAEMRIYSPNGTTAPARLWYVNGDGDPTILEVLGTDGNYYENIHAASAVLVDMQNEIDSLNLRVTNLTDTLNTLIDSLNNS